jgi:uncharacterized protein (DUF2141 family)
MRINVRRYALLLAAGILPLLAAGTATAAGTKASVCVDETQENNRTVCVIVIGAAREFMRDGNPAGEFRACSPVDPDDLSDTYAVMDWIRAHPERQDRDIMYVVPEALQDLHPCT